MALSAPGGETTPAERAEVERHAAGCAACRAGQGRARAVRAGLADLACAPAPEPHLDPGALVARLAPRPQWRRPRSPWPVAGAVLLAGAIAAGVASWRDTAGPELWVGAVVRAETDDPSAGCTVLAVVGRGASDAGLAPGDVITAADGRPVRVDPPLLVPPGARAGDPVRLTVRRGDRVFEVVAVCEVRPAE